MSHSEIQKIVLRLYRDFMKLSSNNKQMREYIRREFRKQADTVARKDFMQIEYLLRRGSNQLKILKNADNITDMKVE